MLGAPGKSDVIGFAKTPKRTFLGAPRLFHGICFEFFIDWVEGTGGLFQLKQFVDAVGGVRAVNVIKGYATEVLAQSIKIPGYAERLAQAVSGRLGGVWTVSLEKEGSKAWVVLTRVLN